MEKFKEIFNFDNIGGKIKNLVKWSCWVSIVVLTLAALITAIVFLSKGYDGYTTIGLIVLAAAIILPFIIWISSWFMYAFGELVERAISIDSRLYYLGKELAPDSKPQNEEITTNETVANGNPSRVNTPEQLGTCEMCEKENVAVFECCYENQYGRFYREMCSDCIEKYNAKRV